MSRRRISLLASDRHGRPMRICHRLHEVMMHTLPRGVRTAHSVSAIFLAAACAGAQPSPHEPVRARAMQYHSAEAAAGSSEIAQSARSENTIVRMILPPMLSIDDVSVHKAALIASCRTS
jgi:hypothetical protein